MPADTNAPDTFDVYTVVLLRRAPDAPDIGSDELDALQARHLEYRAGLRRDGFLAAFGPLGEQSDVRMRGISIWTCDIGEARRLSEGDPMVQAGRLTYDVMEWWVAAGSLAFPAARHAVGERRVMPEG